MILVTGATGLLGNCIVRELLARGEIVRVLTRPGPKRRELEGLNVEIVEGELNDPAVVARAVQGTRAVIHSAAMIHIGYTRLDEARQVNVGGTRTIVDACIQHRSRLIHISTVDTLPSAPRGGKPLTETCSGIDKVPCTYVVSKKESEQVVTDALTRGLDAVILHPGLMFAPNDWKPSSGQMFLGLAKMPFVVAPRGTASVCDARDVAQAVVNAISLGVKGEHYILAGENVPYVELWQKMLAVMGRQARVYPMRQVIPFVVRLLDGVGRKLNWHEGQVNSAVIDMGRLHHAYDSSKAQEQLKYHRRPLDETLRDAWHWLKEKHLAK